MISRIQSWFRAITKRSRLESEMDEEMRFHLDARAADLGREGHTAAEAMRLARIEFGTVARHKDEIRRSLGLRWWDELRGDVRYALRVLRKSPGFAAIAVGSLALAIGANTTIFSVANELLYERLGVPHPEQLRLFTLHGDRERQLAVHSIWGSFDPGPGGTVEFNSFSYPVYQLLQRNNHVLAPIFAFKNNLRVNITVDGAAQAGQLELVSGNYFQQMQIQPALGRAILPADDQTPGAGAVVVISDGFWAQEFGRSPAAIGKVISVNMTPVTIIGVNPPGFTGAKSVQRSPEVFMPLSMIMHVRGDVGHDGSYLTSADLWWVQLMARAKPGVPAQQAQAAMQVALEAAIRATMTLEKGDVMPRLVVEDGSRGLNLASRQFGAPIHVLLAMVGLVLLLACANMANLMLARASARKREMSVRLALGAGRWRILRQVLTESLMLSLGGGIGGLLLGYVGRTTIPKLMFTAWESGDVHVPFDARVFAFTAAITIGTGILFGVAPAWAATRSEIGTALKQGSKTASHARKGWSGRAIVTFQVALSTLLVIGAGLFLRTLINLNSIDPGFKADHLLLFDINAPSARYAPPKDIALHTSLEQALGAVPGVEGVTLSDNPLLADSISDTNFLVDGTPPPVSNEDRRIKSAYMADVGPQFFSVMKIPMLAGRAFSAQDVHGSQQKSVINQALARKFFPGQDPIGKHFRLGGSTSDKWIEVVGICADTRYNDLKSDPPPIHFDLYHQLPQIGGVTYLVRTQRKPEAIVASLRAAVQRVDPNLPLMDVRTQQQQIDAITQTERLFAALTAGFGLLALALACVGIYGIMAYTVAQRTNEIGIRLALGAERRRVRGMVLGEATWLAGLGVVCGAAIALALGRVVKSMLYGLQPADPVSLAGGASLLVAVALLAAWVPAARAARVEPMEALRHE
jgi:predicted permease